MMKFGDWFENRELKSPKRQKNLSIYAHPRIQRQIKRIERLNNAKKDKEVLEWNSDEMAKEAEIFKKTCDSLELHWQLNGAELIVTGQVQGPGFGNTHTSPEDVIRRAELVLKNVPGGQILPPNQLSLLQINRMFKGPRTPAEVPFSVRKVGVDDEFVRELAKGENRSRFVGGRVPLAAKDLFGGNSQEDPHLTLKLNKAKELAQTQNRSYAVVSMDSGEGEAVRVVPEDYLDDEEFHAFNGRVIKVVNPDGSMA